MAVMEGPRFVYTNDASATVDFTLTIPSPPWAPSSSAIGGAEFSASRSPASYELRIDYLLALRLRILESEWANVQTMMEHARRGTQIAVYPDGGLTTHRDCYASEAWMQQLWQSGIHPQPGEFPGELTIDTEWMSATTWAGVYYFTEP